MPLHRDIFWVGRQWAVTGFGMQAVNQKLYGRFDIEASRIWDDGLLEALCTQAWFNPEDFCKGLAAAGERYPPPPGKVLPSPPPQRAAPPQASIVVPPPKRELVPEPPKPAATVLNMRIGSCPAKFTSLWRVGIRR